jgi:archaemetzincin
MLCLALAPVLRASRAGAAEAPLVEVWPLGTAPGAADVEAVVAAVRAFFAVRVTVREPTPLPKAAYHPARGRYRAERLLDHLVTMKSAGARVALGLATVDISTTKGRYADWGVLGLATLDGGSAVLSSFRCKRGARSPAHARERFAKTAVHELGHSFGLDHCATRGCLMHDGEGSVLTSDSETDFCPDTRARLARAGVLLDGATSPFAVSHLPRPGL